MMILELFVQIIEGSFYAYWLYNFNSILDITPKRYIDWAFTTPTMLVTLIFYLSGISTVLFCSLNRDAAFIFHYCILDRCRNSYPNLTKCSCDFSPYVPVLIRAIAAY